MVHKWTLFSLFSRLQSLSPSGERLPGIVPNVAVHILTYAQVELKLFKITVQQPIFKLGDQQSHSVRFRFLIVVC
jgi:hypothetical protein